MIFRQSGERLPGTYFEPFRFATTPSRPSDSRAFDERLPVPVLVAHQLEPVVLLDDQLEELPPLLQGQADRLVAVQPQEVEHHERDRDLLRRPA